MQSVSLVHDRNVATSTRSPSASKGLVGHAHEFADCSPTSTVGRHRDLGRREVTARSEAQFGFVSRSVARAHEVAASWASFNFEIDAAGTDCVFAVVVGDGVMVRRCWDGIAMALNGRTLCQILLRVRSGPRRFAVS